MGGSARDQFCWIVVKLFRASQLCICKLLAPLTSKITMGSPFRRPYCALTTTSGFIVQIIPGMLQISESLDRPACLSCGRVRYYWVVVQTNIPDSRDRPTYYFFGPYLVITGRLCILLYSHPCFSHNVHVKTAFYNLLRNTKSLAACLRTDA